jgi:small subunit ribosomal protein S7
MYTYTPADSTELLEKFVSSMMVDGKKHIARSILQDCFEELKKLGHKNPSDAFEAGVRNIMPQVEVRPKRVGGAVYQIPMEVKSKRQVSLAIRWVLIASRKKKGMPMYKRLANEIHDALSEQGESFKKKEDVRRMAEANKAFAHLAKY